MNITLKTEVHIKLPALPNFITGTSHQQPNAVQEHKFDVSELSDEQLRSIGADWTSALVEHARQRRAQTENVAEAIK